MGPDRGFVGTGSPLNLYGIGDSIIAGVGAKRMENALVAVTARHLAELEGRAVRWEALGIIGANTRKIRDDLVPELPDEPADYIVVSAGVNDLTTITTVPVFRKRLRSLLETIKIHSPDAVIAVNGIPPLSGFPLLDEPLRSVFGIRGNSFDAEIQSVVSDYDSVVRVPIRFAPEPEMFSADGFHPSETSYLEFGELVASAIHECKGILRDLAP